MRDDTMLTYEIELRVKRNGAVTIHRGYSPRNIKTTKRHYFHYYHSVTPTSLDRLMSLFDNSIAKPIIGGTAYVYSNRS